MYRKRIPMARWIMLICAVFLFLLCQRTAADSLSELRLLCSSTSLRYSQELTAEQISAVTAYLQSEKNTDAIQASFWKEDYTTVFTTITRRSIDSVLVVRFYGNAQDVYGANYQKGSAPMWNGGAMCAVSEQLAWSLWGSTDVLGQEVQVDQPVGGTPVLLTVCGVFDSDRELLLCPVPLETGFPYLEVKGLRRDDPFTQCNLLLQQTGLVQPEQILFGEPLTELFSACTFLPWCFGGILLLAAVRQLPHGKTGARRGFDIFCAAFFAAACVVLLHQLPAWLVPNRWADTAAWKAVIGPIQEQWQQWLTLFPAGKDICTKICVSKMIFALHGEAFSFFLIDRTILKGVKSE